MTSNTHNISSAQNTTPLIRREINQPNITPTTLKAQAFAARFWGIISLIGAVVLTGLMMGFIVTIPVAAPVAIMACVLAINLLNHAKALDEAAQALELAQRNLQVLRPQNR